MFLGSVFIPAILIAGLSSIYFAKLGATISNKIDGNSLKNCFFYLGNFSCFENYIYYFSMTINIDPVAFSIPIAFHWLVAYTLVRNNMAFSNI